MTDLDVESITAFLAGAGTGKTFKICQEVEGAILDEMDPERIIVTTFTNRAAAELENRVQQHFYGDDELDLPERINGARKVQKTTIGTVSSLGRQFLDRYAYELGLSPRQEVLDEDASKDRLKDFLAEMDPARWERLHEATRPFALEDPQKVVRDLIRAKRINHVSDEAFQEQMRESLEKFQDILAPDGTDDSLPDRDELPEIAEEVRQQLEDSEYDYAYIDDAIDELNSVIYAGTITWKHLANLTGFNPGTGDKVYEETAPIREFADNLRRSPQLHADLEHLIQVLTAETLHIQDEYQSFKKARGLLDYIDLEVRLLEALEDPAVAEDIARSYDVLLVDEFQDSSPIQLAIFFRLHELVGGSFWVGDEKQSIYGFRGADLGLIQDAVSLLEEDNREPLGTSYRAHQGLVNIFNELFTPVFGEDAILEADDQSVPDCSIERWCLDVTNNANERRSIAEGIRQLIEDGTDPRDVVVLAGSNWNVQSLGERLEERGVPTVIEQPGLLDRRECAAAFAGMKVAADRRDNLARAELHHLMGSSEEGTPTWLVERLENLAEQREQDPDGYHEWENDRFGEALVDIDVKTLSPRSVLESVIQVLDLPRKLADWGRADQRAANLDALLGMVEEYQDRMREEGRGATVRGFVEWAESARDEDEDEIPAREGLDAVTVSTYHRAKGLEWPVVVLTGLNSVKGPDLFEPRVTGGRTRQGEPLGERRIHYWPWPFGKTWRPYGGKQKVSGTGLQDDALQSEAGQTALDQDEAERQRLLYVGMTRASERVVLAHRGAPEDLPEPSNYAWLDQLPVDKVLSAPAEEGHQELDNFDSAIRIRRWAEEEDPEDERHPRTEVDLAGPDADFGSLPPRYVSPSTLGTDSDDVSVRAQSLPGEHPFEEAPRTEDWAALGSAVHAFLAGMPSFEEPGSRDIERIAARCLDNHGMGDVITPDQLMRTGERLLAWLEEEYPEFDLTTEVPLTAPLGESQGVGQIDLIVESPNGECIAVDHKIKPVPESRWEQTARDFAGQMRAYREMLEAMGHTVSDTWIHLPLGGGIIYVEPVY